MNQQDNREPKSRRYRFNKTKLLSTLMSLIAIGVIIAVAIYALSKLGIVTVNAQNPGTTQTSQTSHGVVKVSEGAATPAVPEKSPEDMLILIDPGHGGFDPGAISGSGVQEADLNLAVAQYLKAEFEAQGMQVVMTREDENAIGEDKKADMAERRRIIEESNSDIVISVHMNDYSDDPDVSGPLVLFMPGSQQGKTLAETIQMSLNDTLGADGSARSEDLYILRSGNQPCALVECGYLSNSAEELKLQQSEYQQRIAQAICEGVLAYFGLKA